MILKIKGGHTFIDDEDYPKIKNIKNWTIRVKPDGKKYVYGYPIDGKPLMLHRLLMDETNPNVFIDHINGNGLNNYRVNLRRTTPVQNGQNKKLSKRNSTGWKGVSFRNGKFCARIMAEGKAKFLGYFDEASEAGLAYIEAAKELHKEFARV